MTLQNDPERLMNACGLSFKDPSLLLSAFRHPSVGIDGGETNERLVFLGRTLVDFILADHIYGRYPFTGEGELNEHTDELRDALACDRYVSEAGLTQYILLSEHAEALRRSPAICEEVFFAICAALYKDGGLAALKSFILPKLRGRGEQSVRSERPERTEPAEKPSTAPEFGRQSAPGKRYVPGTEVAETLNGDKETKDVKSAKYKEKEKEVAEEKPKKTLKDGIMRSLGLFKEKRKEQKEAPDTTAGDNTVKTEKDPKADRVDKSAKAEKNGKSSNSGKAEGAEEAPVTVGVPGKGFIRDALTPVRLPDSMKTAPGGKSKKTGSKDTVKDPAKDSGNDANKKTVKDSGKTAKEAVKAAPKVVSAEKESENYKSLLQEYIQKNIRTASVLIKYDTKALSKENFVSTVYLDGKKLAEGTDISKKSSEQEAARLAYLGITEGDLRRWFVAAGEGSMTVAEPTEDHVSKLNRYFQKKHHSSSAPVTYEKRQSQNKKQFTVAVMNEGTEIAVASASSLREAKQEAAKSACEKLGI